MKQRKVVKKRKTSNRGDSFSVIKRAAQAEYALATFWPYFDRLRPAIRKIYKDWNVSLQDAYVIAVKRDLMSYDEFVAMGQRKRVR